MRKQTDSALCPSVHRYEPPIMAKTPCAPGTPCSALFLVSVTTPTKLMPLRLGYNSRACCIDFPWGLHGRSPFCFGCPSDVTSPWLYPRSRQQGANVGNPPRQSATDSHWSQRAIFKASPRPQSLRFSVEVMGGLSSWYRGSRYLFQRWDVVTVGCCGLICDCVHFEPPLGFRRC